MNSQPEKPSREEIEKRVRKVFLENLDVPEERIVAKASLLNDLNADSLDRIELILACEDEFGIDIADGDMARVATFGDAVDLVCRSH